MNTKKIISSVTIYVFIGLFCNAYALDKKREDRWTQWQINNLRWEQQVKKRLKEEAMLPLAERFNNHWKRMDIIEKKYAETAVLLKGIIPDKYSIIHLDLKDEEVAGIEYPKEFTPEEDDFISNISGLNFRKVEAIPKMIRESILQRYKEQDHRLFEIEEKFWNISRVLHEIIHGDNQKIMKLEDESILDDLNNRKVKDLNENAVGINTYLYYNLSRMDELERTLDVMKKWLLVIKSDHGKITKQTLKSETPYDLWRGDMPLHFATNNNKWPVYSISMREITIFDRAEPIFEQKRKEIEQTREALDKRFNEEKRNFNEEFKKTQKEINIIQ